MERPITTMVCSQTRAQSQTHDPTDNPIEIRLFRV